MPYNIGCGAAWNMIINSFMKSKYWVLASHDCSFGTGFLKVSRFALEKLWLASDPYTSEGEEHRMVFDIKVENGDLISEDYVLCNKWKNLGYKVWLDPTITCNHIGIKKFKGDLNKFLDKQGYVRGSSDV